MLSLIGKSAFDENSDSEHASLYTLSALDRRRYRKAEAHSTSIVTKATNKELMIEGCESTTAGTGLQTAGTKSPIDGKESLVKNTEAPMKNNEALITTS